MAPLQQDSILFINVNKTNFVRLSLDETSNLQEFVMVIARSFEEKIVLKVATCY